MILYGTYETRFNLLGNVFGLNEEHVEINSKQIDHNNKKCETCFDFGRNAAADDDDDDNDSITNDDMIFSKWQIQTCF